MRKSHLKLYLSCLLVGAVTALFTIPFRYLLLQTVVLRDFIFAHPFEWWLHLVIILVMWLVALGIYALVKKYPLISGGGNSQSEGFIFGRFHIMRPFKMLLAKFIGGLSGIGMGFSLGREGPSVEMGAFVAKMVGRWVKVSPADEKYLAAGGVSAGFSSAFTVPLAASIYIIEGVEKVNSPKIALSSLLAAIVSGWLAQQVFTHNRYAVIDTTFPHEMSLLELLVAFLAFSLLLSVMGKSFNQLLILFQNKYDHLRVPVSVRILGVVLFTYLLQYFFPDIVSGGENYMLDQAVDMQSSLWVIALSIVIIQLFTSLCCVTGFPGGVFIPMLVIGALTGKFFALTLTHFGWLSPAHFGIFMVLGMAALFAAIIRSPITGLVLILEMTQKFEILFPLIIVVGFTYFFSEMLRVKSIYALMYKRLLIIDKVNENDRTTVTFEVGEGGYMAGRATDQICLPEGCNLMQVTRDGVTSAAMGQVLQPNDMIVIELYQRDLELLYNVFRSMANE